jgi:uncharacterized membrane protein YdcZ (DUF606 family)
MDLAVIEILKWSVVVFLAGITLLTLILWVAVDGSKTAKVTRWAVMAGVVIALTIYSGLGPAPLIAAAAFIVLTKG